MALSPNDPSSYWCTPLPTWYGKLPKKRWNQPLPHQLLLRLQEGSQCCQPAVSTCFMPITPKLGIWEYMFHKRPSRFFVYPSICWRLQPTGAICMHVYIFIGICFPWYFPNIPDPIPPLLRQRISATGNGPPSFWQRGAWLQQGSRSKPSHSLQRSPTKVFSGETRYHDEIPLVLYCILYGRFCHYDNHEIYLECVVNRGLGSFWKWWMLNNT